MATDAPRKHCDSKSRVLGDGRRRDFGSKYGRDGGQAARRRRDGANRFAGRSSSSSAYSPGWVSCADGAPDSPLCLAQARRGRRRAGVVLSVPGDEAGSMGLILNCIGGRKLRISGAATRMGSAGRDRRTAEGGATADSASPGLTCPPGDLMLLRRARPRIRARCLRLDRAYRRGVWLIEVGWVEPPERPCRR